MQESCGGVKECEKFAYKLPKLFAGNVILSPPKKVQREHELLSVVIAEK